MPFYRLNKCLLKQFLSGLFKKLYFYGFIKISKIMKCPKHKTTIQDNCLTGIPGKLD